MFDFSCGVQWCSQGLCSSHPVSSLPCVPTQQWLSISSSTVGEPGFMSCVLPEDLLVTILSERLQVRGVGANYMFLLQRGSKVQFGEEGM